MPAAKKNTITRKDMLDGLRGAVDETITLFYLGYRARPCTGPCAN